MSQFPPKPQPQSDLQKVCLQFPLTVPWISPRSSPYFALQLGCFKTHQICPKSQLLPVSLSARLLECLRPPQIFLGPLDRPKLSLLLIPFLVYLRSHETQPSQPHILGT